MHFPAVRQQTQLGTWKIKLRSFHFLSCLQVQTWQLEVDWQFVCWRARWGDSLLISSSGDNFGLEYCRDWKIQKCSFPSVYSKPVTSIDSYVLLVNEFVLTGILLFRGQQITAEALITWVYWHYPLGLKCFGISEDFWRWIPSVHSYLTSLLWYCACWKLQLLLKVYAMGFRTSIKGDIIPISSCQHCTLFFDIKLRLWYNYTFVISDMAMNFFMFGSLRRMWK